MKLKAKREEKQLKKQQKKMHRRMFFKRPWQDSFDWVKWNRSLKVASLNDVEAKQTVVELDDMVLDWIEMDMKEAPKSVANKEKARIVNNILSKVGI